MLAASQRTQLQKKVQVLSHGIFWLASLKQLSWNTAYNHSMRQKCQKEKVKLHFKQCSQVHWLADWFEIFEKAHYCYNWMNSLCTQYRQWAKRTLGIFTLSHLAWTLSLLQQHDTINFLVQVPPQNSPLTSVTPPTFCINLLSNCNNFHAICLSVFLANSS